MSRLATSFVLGYHGCERRVAEQLVNGKIDFKSSEEPYDWLGPGVYFWEADPQRAMEWALDRQAQGKLSEPAVVGAVIELGECLDLLGRVEQELLREAYRSLESLIATAGEAMPANRNIRDGKDGDRKVRLLDCHVIGHLHRMMDELVQEGLPGAQRFDTVRSAFIEGIEVYPGSTFRDRSHIQIAVINPACIKAIFFPRD